MSYYQDSVDQYYNNVSGNQPGSYQGEYVSGYQQGQQPPRNYNNPRMQENHHFYTTPDLNTKGILFYFCFYVLYRKCLNSKLGSDGISEKKKRSTVESISYIFKG